MWALSKFTRSTSFIKEILRKSHKVVAESKEPTNNEAIPDISTVKIGEIIHGFKLKQVENIDEFKIIAYYMIHEKTKCEYLHLYRNDQNNVFSINFRTTPLNSTGLPHILEHTVLCGSYLYPIRDPFFKMLNRSLATFMNALTASDYTMYPFSTQNLTDYKNLQRIYLDAAFRPNLRELDFMQEGWRLENKKLNDINSELIIKGVVYNEMKGAFSDNDRIYEQKLQNLILPDHTYGVISGGDPLKIPNLTWNDLKEFHKKFYHPSNCRFYSYGNFPLLSSLKYINDEYLENYEFESCNHTKVPSQIRWKQSKEANIIGRFDKMGDKIEKQNIISISLLMSDVTDVYETFIINFISQLLIKGPNAPFYKSLIESNFSGGYNNCTGYDSQPRDTYFTVGLQNIKKEDFSKFLKLFDETIDNVIINGFDSKHIESVLHGYELTIKHEMSNFGLNLLFGISSPWNHNGEIIKNLQVIKLINKLKDEINKNDKYLQNYIEKYFKNNNHRLILKLLPDIDFDNKQLLLENELIKNKTKNLTNNDLKNIYEKNLQLENELKKKENIEILPTLTMNDINDDVERIPITKLNINSTPLQINKINSNGIVYFKSILSTIDLSPDQQMLLPLFCDIITKFGSNKMNYRDFDNYVNMKTSGLIVSPFIGESLFHLHSYEPAILISSYCLEKNTEEMFNIWLQIFNLSKLDDVKRFEMLVQVYMSNLTNNLALSGHIYAMLTAAGLVSGTSYQKDLLGGLQHISYMKRLVKISNYKAMLDELLNIAKIVFNKSGMRCALNISGENENLIVKQFEKHFLTCLPKKPLSSDSTYQKGKIWAPPDSVNCQYHILNLPINFCSKSILTAPYTDRDFAKVRILARLLTNKYLHKELREKHGAYGGGAKLSMDGVLSFFSYRDPRNLESLDVFDESIKWLKDNIKTITEQDILESKLGVFQSIDAPIIPSMKGCEEFLRRLTPDILQRQRADIMSVDLDGIYGVAEKYFKNKDILASKVIIGPKLKDFDTSKRLNELWTIVDNE